MHCLLTIRRLKPGAHEEFRRLWAPDKWPEQTLRAYHLRNLDDPDEVITFGIFEGTADEIDAMRDSTEWLESEDRRLRRLMPLEEQVTRSGSYEVVEEIIPTSSRGR